MENVAQSESIAEESSSDQPVQKDLEIGRRPEVVIPNDRLSASRARYRRIDSNDLVQTAASDQTNETNHSPVIISGTITGEQFDPVIGASIRLSDSKASAVTDIEGRYQIELPSEDYLDNGNLVVSYVGYEDQSVDINRQQNIDVVLHEGVELNEVVVAGYGKKQPKVKKNKGPRGIAYAMASPIGGWDDYYKYIRKEIKRPKQAKEADIEGSVWLEFNIDRNGMPTEIRVVESLGYGCDEEAIRLVREGPKWDVESAQVPIGRLQIDF